MFGRSLIKRVCKTFTLIEMLVVIAIIGILASMLMPSLRSAMDSARMMACTNNSKQIGTGMLQYANDYESFPLYMDSLLATNPREWNRISYANCALEYMLASYMGGTRLTYRLSSGTGIFICPSSGMKMGDNNSYYYEGVSTGSNVNNYSGLWFHYDQALSYGRRELLSPTSFKSPDRSPYQYCSRNKAPTSTMINGWTSNSVTTPSWHGDSRTPPRPTVFVDGHATVLTDILYTMGEGDLPNWKDSWRLIAYNRDQSLNNGADVFLEEY